MLSYYCISTNCTTYCSTVYVLHVIKTGKLFFFDFKSQQIMNKTIYSLQGCQENRQVIHNK